MSKKKRPEPPECHCGKVIFYSNEDAITLVLWKQAYRDAPALRIYRCPMFPQDIWHITSDIYHYGRKRGRDKRHEPGEPAGLCGLRGADQDPGAGDEPGCHD